MSVHTTQVCQCTSSSIICHSIITANKIIRCIRNRPVELTLPTYLDEKNAISHTVVIMPRPIVWRHYELMTIVCLSLCPSVTRLYCVYTAKSILKIFTIW